MLTDPVEIEIISRAQQKNVRDPNRSRLHFINVFNEFFTSEGLTNKAFLDLGPGQYDFGEMAREYDSDTWGIDRDPAVIKLGQHKGYTVFQKDLESLKASQYDQRFDGIFCKYSFNAFWYKTPEQQQQHTSFVNELTKLLKPDGWAWLGPWNGDYADLPKSEIGRILKCQVESFLDNGFWGIQLSEDQTIRYGIHGKTANRALFCKNLDLPQALQSCPKLTPQYLGIEEPSLI